MRFEIYEGFIEGSSDGVTWEYESAGWYWRLRASNGRIVADGSEDYSSKTTVKRAVKRIQAAFARQANVPIVEVES